MYPQQRPPSTEPPPEPPQQYGGLRRVAVRMPLAEPRLTYALLAVIVLIFMYFLSLPFEGQSEFLTRWAKVNDLIREGEPYRLLTSMFLHLNLMHILFNGYALFVIGRDVEALFGHVRFALIYFLGGLSGSLASFVFTDAPSVGASGAIFAIFGAEMVYFYQNRKLHGEMGRRHLNQLIFLMLLNLGLGFFSSATSGFRLDNAGHIGGLVGGVVLAWFIGPEFEVAQDASTVTGLRVVDRNEPRQWAGVSLAYAVGLVAMTVYAVAA
jgi:rhomboid protease GluP